MFLLKTLVTLVCLWWLSRYFDYQQVRSALSGINPAMLIAAIVLHFLSFLAGGIRWWLLLQHLSGPISFRVVWPSYYMGVFYNNLLPSLYGGDIVRTARLYAAGMRGFALVSSAFVDRVLGLASILCMGLLALIFAPAEFENDLAAGVSGMGLIILLMVLMLAVLPRSAR